jgi:pteridine reductase
MNDHPVALITGSGKKRLGWHIADALAGRGYSVGVHYHFSAGEAALAVDQFRTRGVEAESFQADLASDRGAAGLVHQVLERFHRIDVLVNCAAIWHRQRFEDVSADAIRAHFHTNILGTFLCAQQAGLAMVMQPEGGNIINFGDWAMARPYLNYSAYFASKGAIPALTSCLAVELGTRNPRVRVNAVLPGPVMLPHDLPEAERAEAIEATLVHREGSPQNIVKAVLYLIDNDFVTGTCLTVDGGRTIYAGGT